MAGFFIGENMSKVNLRSIRAGAELGKTVVRNAVYKEFLTEAGTLLRRVFTGTLAEEQAIQVMSIDSPYFKGLDRKPKQLCLPPVELDLAVLPPGVTYVDQIMGYLTKDKVLRAFVKECAVQKSVVSACKKCGKAVSLMQYRVKAMSGNIGEWVTLGQLLSLVKSGKVTV